MAIAGLNVSEVLELAVLLVAVGARLSHDRELARAAVTAGTRAANENEPDQQRKIAR